MYRGCGGYVRRMDFEYLYHFSPEIWIRNRISYPKEIFAVKHEANFFLHMSR
jgi:hypothetical protein